MTLTPEQSSTITRHLAEKVLGWEEVEICKNVAFCWKKDGRLVCSCSKFNPLTDPRDCSLVMEAWYEAGNGLSINLDALGTTHPWTARAYLGRGQRTYRSNTHATESEAACLAIFRASGGTGI